MFLVELVILSRQQLNQSQIDLCRKYSNSVTVIGRRENNWVDKLAIATIALKQRVPYHTAVVEWSLRSHPIYNELLTTRHLVYCSQNTWGLIAKRRSSVANWILDQHNADVEFWHIYAQETRSIIKKFVAMINARLALRHFRELYEKVGCVVSVCEDDKKLTKQITPTTRVEVIENGVDCSYFHPSRIKDRTGSRRILFTGQSTERNMKALRNFMKNVLPSARKEIPDVEFMIGGSFSSSAQAELRNIEDVSFTGRVPNLRPVYDESDVFVSPFEDSYGSKLKVSQALAMGICVVASSAGVRGFPVVDGETALIARDDEEMVSQLILALTDDEYRERIGAAGRKLAILRLDWSVLGEHLRKIVTSL